MRARNDQVGSRVLQDAWLLKGPAKCRSHFQAPPSVKQALLCLSVVVRCQEIHSSLCEVTMGLLPDNTGQRVLVCPPTPHRLFKRFLRFLFFQFTAAARFSFLPLISGDLGDSRDSRGRSAGVQDVRTGRQLHDEPGRPRYIKKKQNTANGRHAASDKPSVGTHDAHVAGGSSSTKASSWNLAATAASEGGWGVRP